MPPLDILGASECSVVLAVVLAVILAWSKYTRSESW